MLIKSRVRGAITTRRNGYFKSRRPNKGTRKYLAKLSYIRGRRNLREILM